MQIVVKIKSVYGNQMVYPVCAKAQLFASLAGTKTLSERNLKDIKALGYSIASGNESSTFDRLFDATLA